MKGVAIQQYPLKAPLPVIQRHDQLPVNTKEIGSKLDKTTAPGYENLYVFAKNHGHLSILMARTRNSKKLGTQYYCDQFDFPLKVLSWFPKALEEFRKPPIAGGLPAGAMISPDQDVDGEMLAVGRTTSGYDLTNWSRNSHTASPGYYEPTRLSFSSEFLYDHGFLALWKELGENYECGLY